MDLSRCLENQVHMQQMALAGSLDLGFFCMFSLPLPHSLYLSLPSFLSAYI
jgi:hypothetical protein